MWLLPRRRLGNEDWQGNSADLTFVVQQQLHPAFRRLADDLYAIVNVPLVTALTGGPVALRTLSGQLLQLPVGDDVITPGSELVLPNQGMPVFGDAAGRRGSLHVRFNVSFPSQLSRQQQVLLRHTLQVRGSSSGIGCRASVATAALLDVVWFGGRRLNSGFPLCVCAGWCTPPKKTPGCCPVLCSTSTSLLPCFLLFAVLAGL